MKISSFIVTSMMAIPLLFGASVVHADSTSSKSSNSTIMAKCPDEVQVYWPVSKFPKSSDVPTTAADYKGQNYTITDLKLDRVTTDYYKPGYWVGNYKGTCTWN
ncbi:hypothetical protein [Brevibacillus laterosporus]|uniref:Uncharacterized protein n=1 Tax=Brevibacillus laterosporus TaxID=1465 RepID=A0AAP3DLS7_BRELA|nr:hypothetical protein [Brevibacillus laterosporus]MBG9788734.1 hypothetical protein [Brevibacillus laterosporus]MCR8982280.1 hypothetical protein [Brevibacillus laterosporus]MCZ0809435.1 hypothetical protein [Brevibacillus laterosporus]MCZ0827850.1 hypothetical protein [Brevibacillus laterosporus]MCZ0851790.1 hypothetical protein [Brevibacillus laterosporus]